MAMLPKLLRTPSLRALLGGGLGHCVADECSCSASSLEISKLAMGAMFAAVRLLHQATIPSQPMRKNHAKFEIRPTMQP
jgi:hypothetical protein